MSVTVRGAPKRGRPTAFKCRWKVSGELSGRVPVRCKGKATYKVHKKKVTKLSPCKNREERQAPLLAAPHDVLFGYFEDFTTHGNLFGELGASGANTLREGITWNVLQPIPGAPATWNWAPYDSVYAGALAIGVRPVWTFTSAPCWAAPSPCGPNANPVAGSHVSDYAFAAAQIALRYPQSAAIEVWSQPNDAKFWGAPADPRAFSELVGAAAAAIHATGTGVGVYSGGLLPGRGASDRVEMDQFLSQALAAGGIEGADAIGFHAVADVPFTPGDDPTKGYLGRMRINIEALNSELADANVTRPIAITELAFSTAGPGRLHRRPAGRGARLQLRGPAPDRGHPDRPGQPVARQRRRVEGTGVRRREKRRLEEAGVLRARQGARRPNPARLRVGVGRLHRSGRRPQGHRGHRIQPGGLEGSSQLEIPAERAPIR